MSVKSLTRSFAGGEITPELFGRVDLAKFQTGLKTCRNFEILPHGPAANRAGFEYVLQTKFNAKKSILIPFIYNTSQTYQLEFGDLYVRFHTQGGTVLEAAQAITSYAAGVFTKVAHGLVTGQWIFWTDVVGPSNLNLRFLIVTKINNDTFSCTDLFGVAFVCDAAYTSGNAARVYEIVSPFAEADLHDADGAEALHYTQSSDVLTLTHPSYDTRELRRSGATSWAFSTVAFSPAQAAPTAVTVTPGGAGAVTYTYIVTAVAQDGLEESLSSAAGTNAACASLATAGATVKVTWTNAAGAVRYNVYRQINGLFGYVGQATDGTIGFTDINYTPNALQSPPEAGATLTGADNRPGAVGYFEGRRWFAGSNNKPQGLFATRSGTESNMTHSIPTQADDAIAVRLTSRQNNTIRHIVPGGDLVLLTSGGEWKVSNGGVGAITPLNLTYHPEDYIGASNVTPVTTASSILYCADRGGRVRELDFQWQQQGYRSADLSIMAPHLFDSYRLTSMTYSRGPLPFMWATRNDGTLMGLTYVKEHDVAAWHHHDSKTAAGASSFESACATPESAEDVLYAIVRRVINGRTVRYLERKRSRNFGGLANAFFVDSGSTYNGAQTTHISGLWHLEGETVNILADGAVLTPQTVTGGALTLAEPASVVNIGLEIEADLETLPLALEMQASGQGTQKNVNKVYLRVSNSSGLFIGPDLAHLAEAKTRTTEPYGTPPHLISDVISVVISPTWNPSGGVSMRQRNPLPTTVLSMTLEAALGG